MRATLATGVVLGLGSVGTMAAWSESVEATSGVFSTSSVNITVDGQDAIEFASLSMANMIPGSTKNANLIVGNAGGDSFTYTMQALVNGSDDFGKYLKVSVFLNECSGSPLAGGVQMRSAQSPISMISIPRSLAAPGGAETLCFSVSLDPALWNQPNWTAAQTVEGKTVDVRFKFTATATES